MLRGVGRPERRWWRVACRRNWAALGGDARAADASTLQAQAAERSESATDVRREVDERLAEADKIDPDKRGTRSAHETTTDTHATDTHQADVRRDPDTDSPRHA